MSGQSYFFTSTADDETSEKELETCYESCDSSAGEDSPQEGEVNMTESVAGPSQWPSCWDKKMWTRCVFIIVYLYEYTLLSFYNSSTDYYELYILVKEVASFQEDGQLI